MQAFLFGGPMNAKKKLDTFSSPVEGSARVGAAAARGFTLVELMVVVAMCVVMTAVALPRIDSTMHEMHLGSASSSLANAIQSARYQAISSGCPAHIAISAQTYQVASGSPSGNPPTCTTTTAAAIPFATVNGDVTLTPTTAVYLYLNSDGTVEPVATITTIPAVVVPAPQSLTLGLTQSAGTAIKTISVSGLGYVKVQ